MKQNSKNYRVYFHTENMGCTQERTRDKKWIQK